MENIAKKIRQELDILINNGMKIFESMKKDKKISSEFVYEYQQWYTRSLAVISQLLPDRIADFKRFYHLDKRNIAIDVSTYTIEDYMQGLKIEDYEEFDVATTLTRQKIGNQLYILRSAASRLDDLLANIQGILQADLFDSEVSAARELKKNGHLRAAGVVVGVVIERHLAKVCQNHGLAVRKKNPGISDFNELLKKSDIFDIPTWRWMQRLADIRNLCGHPKEREPTPDEVQELIDGVDKAIKTIS